MIIKLEAKEQKSRERETGGVSIRAKKVKDREVRWKSEAKLRNHEMLHRKLQIINFLGLYY